MAWRLSNGALKVNGKNISYKANSLQYNKGRGEATGEAITAGGNAIDFVYGEDASTKIAMVKFELVNIKEHVDILNEWFSNNKTGGSTIEISETNFSVAFNNSHLMKDPDISMSTDGSLEILFQGKPSQ